MEYTAVRLGGRWCLTADQPLDPYSGKTTMPVQMVIKSPKGHNNTQKPMYDTSLLVFQGGIPDQVYRKPEYSLDLYPLAGALVCATPRYFQVKEIATHTCSAMTRDAADILKILTKDGASLRAGRIAGAFRSIGNGEITDGIVFTIWGFGYDMREEDPFGDQPRTPLVHEMSPYVTRLRLMWENMGDKVVELLPEAPGKIDGVEEYLRSVDEKYSRGACHSLSIGGYRISPELIEKMRVGNWKPEEEDKEHKNVLMTRRYYQTFQAVRGAISDILKGKDIGEAVRADHPVRYMQIWMSFVTVGILQREDLVGYHTGQVHIRRSQHIPLNPKAVRDAMPVPFDLLKNEPHPAVRAILGHFFFVYIHPYVDGNGKMGRFVLSAVLASGGYNQAVVPVERRREYMRALEEASVEEDISEFAKVITLLIK